MQEGAAQLAHHSIISCYNTHSISLCPSGTLRCHCHPCKGNEETLAYFVQTTGGTTLLQDGVGRG